MYNAYFGSRYTRYRQHKLSHRLRSNRYFFARRHCSWTSSYLVKEEIQARLVGPRKPSIRIGLATEGLVDKPPRIAQGIHLGAVPGRTVEEIESVFPDKVLKS